MKIYQWSAKAQEYGEIYLPDYNFVANPNAVKDINQKAVCPNCLKSFTLGDGFVSKIYQNEYGLGYAICPCCHKKEVERLKQLEEGK